MTSAKLNFCNEFFFLHFFLFVSFLSLQTCDQELRTGAKNERCLQGKSLLLCTLLLSALLGFALLVIYMMMTCGLGIIQDIRFPASSLTPLVRPLSLLSASVVLDLASVLWIRLSEFQRILTAVVKKGQCTSSSVGHSGERAPHLFFFSAWYLIHLGPVLRDNITTLSCISLSCHTLSAVTSRKLESEIWSNSSTFPSLT